MGSLCRIAILRTGSSLIRMLIGLALLGAAESAQCEDFVPPALTNPVMDESNWIPNDDRIRIEELAQWIAESTPHVVDTGCDRIQHVIASKHDVALRIVQTDVSRGMTRCPHHAQLVLADSDARIVFKLLVGCHDGEALKRIDGTPRIVNNWR